MKKKKPLGCFSASAIIAFIITLATVGVVTATSGASLFSPGKLSTFSEGQALGGVASHSEIGKDCAACHAAPWSRDTMSDRCQTCHTGIKLDAANDTTLHGTLLQKTPELQCRDCHPDHRGPDAPLTEMALETFPHDVVGFSLASHQIKPDSIPFTCGDCHTETISTFSQTTCTECHQQINAAFTQAHELAFGNDCLACHDGLESYGADFDHNQTNFALTGKHIETVCSKCHLDARSIQDFAQASPACAACHLTDDAHN
ncbi:MAG: cytochrome c3 family protein, partial [Anaerolineales bacterium]|nr:cytochrome c3 family protein [Anaerolineales bacterium]